MKIKLTDTDELSAEQKLEVLFQALRSHLQQHTLQVSEAVTLVMKDLQASAEAEKTAKKES